MTVTDKNKHSGDFSFEFYPPRTEDGEAALLKVHAELAALRPEFFSVTYGAGGSTREGTRRVIMQIHHSGSVAVPHLSFGNAAPQELRALLQDYQGAGIKRLVVLRGDIPSGIGAASQYRYASELIAFIRKETGDHFHIDVACYPEIHPQADSYESDIAFFKQKVDAGADSAITQYFYNPDAYFYFLERCQAQGISIPVVPGIMPITNYARLARFSASCGAEIPRWIAKRLEGFGDDTASIRSFGADVVTDLCDKLLLGGAPGLHFYTMNQAQGVVEIWRNLDLSAR